MRYAPAAQKRDLIMLPSGKDAERIVNLHEAHVSSEVLCPAFVLIAGDVALQVDRLFEGHRTDEVEIARAIGEQ